MNPVEGAIPEGIAIIGMSGRFPEARNTEELWRKLRSGSECISRFTAEELNTAGIPANAQAQSNFVNAGGVLDDIDRWDALFFGTNARDAEIMDPQQRLFLECAWESLENAGYNPDLHEGPIGVYAGTSMSTYVFQIYANADRFAHLDQMQVMILNDKDHLTTHVSYKLNLTGPSLVIQSACSTSLVAICTACDGLWNHRCDMALAGGVAISVPQRKGYIYQPGGILSPDGHCRAFDASAQGTVAGNGVGVVVLKRLSEAVADRDRIYAVIRGAAVNNDGSFKIGYTAPSVFGQANVISMAHTMAGIDPGAITYVEAHGTGTQLGDPIEIAALTEAFRLKTDKVGFCAIGSAKTNVGHLDPAAGVTGLIKTALALERGEIPPSLHFEKPNPDIDFEKSPFYVNTELKIWTSESGPRRAGVSSFGIGGTNAHCVLEEAPAIEASGESRAFQILALSAKTRTALEKQAQNLAASLRDSLRVNLADAAYVLQVGRKHFAHRRLAVIPTEDVAGAIACLANSDSPLSQTNSGDAKERPIVFLFPGQGTQHIGMGLLLYHAEPVFRRHVDECCALLRHHLDCDLRSVLYPSEQDREEALRKLNRTAYTQPALFTVEYALAKLFQEWGIHPTAMIGHSIGEYVAACLSGVFSLEDALRVVAARGRLMDGMPEGAMLAIPVSEQEARSTLNGSLGIAAINGPSSCVLAGSIADIERLERRFAASALPCKRLTTSHAFHSGMMDAAVKPFVDFVRQMRLAAPSIPYLSNVTGTWISAEQAVDPEYYGRQLRDAVRFADGLTELLREPEWVYFETGPGNTITGLLRQQNLDVSRRTIVASPLGTSESSALQALGRLWLSGAPVDWKAFSADEKRSRIPLPAYPFERQRYWIGAPDKPESVESIGFGGDRRSLDDWFYVPVWTQAESVTPRDSRGSRNAERFLLFIDESGLGEGLRDHLISGGGQVTTVRVGGEFRQVSESEFQVPPTMPDGYDQILKQLASTHGLPDRIVHLWLVSGSDDPTASHDRGFRSLLCLAQSLGRQSASHDIRIEVVSSGLQSIRSDDPIHPSKATVLGPCRVIPQEYPTLSTRSIDVDLSGGVQPPVQEISNEMFHEAPVGMVAYRDGKRWLQSYEPVRLEESEQPELLRRKGGVYIVTGGLGGIGMAIAGHLARLPGVKLVLIGRSPIPPQSEWDQWLAGHPDDDLTSQKIRAIQAMESAGSEVMIASASVADRSAMEQVLRLARERFGPVHGLVHSAGVAGGGMIQLKTEEVAASVLAPKVDGTLALHDLLSGDPLDFFVICSSLASVYGGFGQVDYCAANNFLDAYARAHSSTRCPVISINWDTWREVGMAVHTHVPPEMQQAREESLARGIAPSEGVEAFLRILNTGITQVAVCTTDLQSSLSTVSGGIGEHWAAPAPADAPGRTTHPRPSLTTTFAASVTGTERTVAGVWQDLLGIEPVGIHDNFFELGGHSLLAIQVVSQIRSLFDVEIPVQKLFDSATVAQLAQHIDSAREETGDLEMIARLLDQVEQLSESEVKALLNPDGKEPGPGPSGRAHYAR